MPWKWLACFLLPLTIFSSEIVYTIPPTNFAPKMTVSGCFCESNGDILLLLRQEDRSSASTWCLPAGKIAMQESPINAAIRHLKVATGICVEQSACSMFKKFYLRLPDKDFELYLFKINLDKRPEIDLNKKEHIAFKWVSSSEAFSLPLIPGADIYLKKLMEEKKPQ